MKESVKKLSEMILQCERIVFFGGAGVSTESGVKDYRSEDGLYQTVKEYGVSPEVILSHSFFFAKPEIFYDFYRKYFISSALPNDAHRALAKLEEMGKLTAVITQNIDSLHQKAGSKEVIELHGNASKFHCVGCSSVTPDDAVISAITKGMVPKCPHCGSLMKPKVVLYEEPLYPGVAEGAISHIENAQMLIVGGTSLKVYPAASFVDYFRGKYLVIINREETSFDKRADLVISEKIGQVMKEVITQL